jgi:hypothetical protein
MTQPFEDDYDADHRDLAQFPDGSLIAELKRRRYEVSWTDPEHGTQIGVRPNQ